MTRKLVQRVGQTRGGKRTPPKWHKAALLDGRWVANCSALMEEPYELGQISDYGDVVVELEIKRAVERHPGEVCKRCFGKPPKTEGT